jgi:hypothetical protein
MKAFAYFIPVILCLLFPACGTKQTGQSSEPVVVEARMSNRSDTLVQAEFILKMRKNIHIFSSESRSFEITTVETLGLAAPSLSLPAPKKIRVEDGTKADSYSGTVKILLSCRVTALPWKMRGYVQYQACDNTQCFFPTRKWFSFSSATPDSCVKTLSDAEPDSKANE